MKQNLDGGPKARTTRPWAKARPPPTVVSDWAMPSLPARTVLAITSNKPAHGLARPGGAPAAVTLLRRIDAMAWRKPSSAVVSGFDSGRDMYLPAARSGSSRRWSLPKGRTALWPAPMSPTWSSDQG